MNNFEISEWKFETLYTQKGRKKRPKNDEKKEELSRC